MRRYHSWLAALSLAAATPGLALAGPLSLFSGDKESAPTPETDAKAFNDKVAGEIAKSLRAAKLNGYDIEVIFEKGTATLVGEVPSAKQREAATAAARQIPGVKSVSNQLKVPQAQAQAKRPANPAANPLPRKPKAPIQQVEFEDARTADGFSAGNDEYNQEVADRIAETLRQAKFSGVDVGIQFQDGIATISGSVADPRRRTAATAIISKVPGVKRVDNRLEVAVAAAPQRRPVRRPIQQVQYDEQQQFAQPGPMPGQMPGSEAGGYPNYPAGAMMPAPNGAPSPMYGAMAMNGSNPAIYDQPNLPEHAWPAYASYPNYAAVTYPKQYSPSAWPYIGPFYPYPQVPLGWRKVQLEWDDGYWQLNFRPRTDRWWWFMDYRNW